MPHRDSILSTDKHVIQIVVNVPFKNFKSFLFYFASVLTSCFVASSEVEKAVQIFLSPASGPCHQHGLNGDIYCYI